MADLGDSLQGAPQEDDPRIAEKIADPPLADLIAEANAKYAQKDYKSAAELYSRATEKQAEVNGEMSPQNADLLYCYGRCLYHVAISKSDVLGSKVAGESRNDGENASKPKPSNPAPAQSADGEGRETEELITAVVAGDDQDKSSGGKPTAAKPYFQFMGDENFDDSNEEDEAGDTGNDGLEEQEDDEFSDAFEILDLARVLFQKRLDETEKPPKQGPERSAEGRVLDAVKQIQERLADTYDLQAEISLEGEQFPRAVTDLKAALELKSQLFPSYSSLIAETHYKLSLALEFASVTQQMEAGKEVDQTQPAHVDEALREEAAKEMEAAIASCKQRIEREEVTLAIKASGEDGTTGTPKITRESVDEVKEMVQDMEQRVSSFPFFLRWFIKGCTAC